MLNTDLATFYERDLRKLIEEINLFETETDVWKTTGLVKNSCGNLALHIIGGLNYLVGSKLANTGYIRNRELEFSSKGVERKLIVAQLEKLIPMIQETLRNINVDADYPVPFDDAIRTNGYVLVQLSLHLNYHLGQINYLRRILH
jgi:hypothetical protein